MKNTKLIYTILVIIVLVCAGYFVYKYFVNKKTAKTPDEQLQEFLKYTNSGTLEKIEGNVLTLKIYDVNQDSFFEKNYELHDDTYIKTTDDENKYKQISKDDVKSGDMLIIMYDDKDGKNFANDIEKLKVPENTDK